MRILPTLELCDFLDFVVTAWRDGVRRPCFAYQHGDRIVVLEAMASPKRLAHEWLHWREPERAHEPWYAFDVFSYNPLRLVDKHDAVKRSALWRRSAYRQAVGE